VSDAYRSLLGLRLRLQLRAIAGGDPPTSKVGLSELSPLERTRVAEAFRAIRLLQAAAETHFHASF
jgi:CBS domain-containing protein